MPWRTSSFVRFVVRYQILESMYSWNWVCTLYKLSSKSEMDLSFKELLRDYFFLVKLCCLLIQILRPVRIRQVHSIRWRKENINSFVPMFWYHLSFIFPVAQLSKVHDRSLVTSSVANRFEPPSTGYLGGWYVISFKNLKDRTLVGSNTA